MALLCWLSHLHLMVGDGTVGGALLGSGSLQGEVGQLGRAKPLCLKFHPDLPDRPFFPISVYHGPWAGPTPVKEPPLGTCGRSQETLAQTSPKGTAGWGAQGDRL